MMIFAQNIKAAARPLILLLPVLMSSMGLPAIGRAENSTDRIRSAVVKIKNISQRPSFDSPWKDEDFTGALGSGVIIAGNRILTSAHVVSDSKYIEIEKESDSTPYRGVVSYIAHDCDLALVDVIDRSFFEGTSFLPFNDQIPELGSVVGV